MISEPLPSNARAERRRRAEADAKIETARELTFSSLAQVSGIPLEAFAESDQRYVAKLKREAAEAIRKIREYLPKRG